MFHNLKTFVRSHSKAAILFCFLYFIMLSSTPKNVLCSAKCPQYKVILFDSYGTLIDVNSLIGTIRKVLNSTDPIQSQVLLDSWRTKQLDFTWLRSLMKSSAKDSYADFWTVTKDALKYSAEKFNISMTQSQQDELMNAWLRLQLFPDVKDSLAKLKTKYKLAVLSNGSPRMLREVFKSNGLDDLIDPTNEFSVDTVRLYKPHPYVYSLAERKLHVSKSRILFVSGNSWDAIGAKAYGFQSVWLNRIGEPYPDLGISTDFEISNLHQLADKFS
ncbi:(S)-2-haloacid dehalogenase [Pseudolycoriella hygida]|uniref:(S)-2-haloacid dehalogenase n=1 Tax=Pseudolycoriella hygida TaxID=35572 RepID=A0A9Q0S4H8_9DIPT|nr:(S)-2-haloacid dehalogenase [Pseudolycoriella hygida]